MQAVNHWTRQLAVIMPRRREGVAARVLDGEAVLFDRDSGRTHRMNETALYIWDCCAGTRTTEQVARDIAAQYAVDVESALVDVEQTLAVFAQVGLIGSTAQ